MPRCVMVLCTPRSGSSLVAGILHRIGVDMGEGNLQPPDGSNARGYYEDLRWQKIDKRIVGPRYDMGCPAEIPERIQNKYRKLIAVCESRPLWGMKDPRMVFTAQWIWPYLAECRVVAVRRHLWPAAHSLMRHSEVSYGGTLQMSARQAADMHKAWREAMERRLGEFQGPVLEVKYEDVLADPAAWVARLAQFTHEGLGMAATRAQIARAVRFVRPEMNHAGCDNPGADNGG